ncbi:hypothetical protein GCM10028796_09790 [Ramlibacter monticola]|uniref:Elongation factor EFG domain-containing protein n=1 Tax=Ramlibacter monticola TaxID=1926872 RepID=A0A936YWB3_9BURK|nr:hypothetical protein [Ramlibacter monticola]MBL0389834.1 hypothetical protein [Ramlibacter monticola]
MSFPAALTRDDMEALDTLDLLPLRQRVGATHGKPLAAGGHSLLDALSRPDRFRILRHGAGGQILARNGLALAEAQHLLRQAYGAAIAFGSPTVHTVTDRATGQVLAPLMFLRIAAPRAYRQDLVQLLARCSPQQGTASFEGNRVVVRAELPLARLIGLEREVLDRTEGAADVLCRLARYGPVPGHAGEGLRA